MPQALGIIEVVGLTAAIAAADTALKVAQVELLGYELTKGKGLVTVRLGGDVGAVSAAVEAAVTAAQAVHGVNAFRVMPKPHEDVAQMLNRKKEDTVD